MSATAREQRADSPRRLRAALVGLGLAALAVAYGSRRAVADERPTDSPRRIEILDASPFLGDLEGTFVARTGERTLVHGLKRARSRFVPASTFKIPNMLIALETGVAPDADFRLTWDGKRPEEGFWPSSWSRDHTLRSAMQNGVLWYFQEIARRVGRERMQSYVEQFEYGNQDVSGVIDRFWLDGPLKISPLEQVDFVERFYESRLELSQRTTDLARNILVLEKHGDSTLSGKTGTAPPDSGRVISWFVGYLERDDGVVYFALNLDCPSFDACNHAMRRRLVLSILEDWRSR